MMEASNPPTPATNGGSPAAREGTDDGVIVKLTPEQIAELNNRGVYNSTAIIQFDQYNDPINYWVGMWEKMIILASIKKEADIQNINTNTSYHSLDWHTIYQDIIRRTRPKTHGFLSVSTCLKWFENRMRIFEYHFPSYRYYDRDAITLDKLMKHYSSVLKKIRDADLALFKYLQYNNLHSWPPSTFQMSITEATESLEQVKEIMSPVFCSLDLLKSAPGVRPILLPANKPAPSNVSVKCHLSKNEGGQENYKEQTPATASPAVSKLDGSVVSLPQTFADLMGKSAMGATMFVKIGPEGDENDQLCAQNLVIEHKSPSPPSPITELRDTLEMQQRRWTEPVLSGNFSGSDNHPGTCEQPKRSKISSVETSRACVLSILWKFRENAGLMQSMSRSLTEKSSQNGGTCDFTLESIEKKILNGEIVCLRDLLANIESLITAYITSKENNGDQVSPELITLLKSLKNVDPGRR